MTKRITRPRLARKDMIPIYAPITRTDPNVKEFVWQNNEFRRRKHRKNESASNIYCPFCGFCCLSLCGHLASAHKIKQREAKDLFGLTLRGRMTCAQTHIKKKNENLKRYEEGTLTKREKLKSDTLWGHIESDSNLRILREENLALKKRIKELESKLENCK